MKRQDAVSVTIFGLGAAALVLADAQAGAWAAFAAAMLATAIVSARSKRPA